MTEALTDSELKAYVSTMSEEPLIIGSYSSARQVQMERERGDTMLTTSTALSDVFTSSIGGSLEVVEGAIKDESEEGQFSFVSTDATAEAIRLCEKWVLRPLSIALKIIGWIPPSHTRAGRIAHVFLVIIWTIAILTAMVTQILSCFRRDVFVSSEVVPGSDIEPNSTILPPGLSAEEMNISNNARNILRCEDHIISSLILGNFVLMANYFFGVYLFTKGETEYLFRLASHVFVKNAEAQTGGSSKRLVGIVAFFFFSALVWLFFSLSIRIMTAISVELFDPSVVIVWPPNLSFENGSGKIVLLVLSLFGFFTFDLVYLFSVLNYAAQSEFNVYLLWDIRRLLETKKYASIDAFMKDTLECQRYLKVLNGKTATLTALALFLLANLGLTALIDLDRVNERGLDFIPMGLYELGVFAATLNVICWFILIALPFIQAARITYMCERLKDSGPEIRARPLQYRNTPQLDLDSVVSFLSAVDIKASLYGVPIYPWMMYAVLVGFTFTMLVLFQQGIYSFSKYL